MTPLGGLTKMFRFGEDVMQPGTRYVPKESARLEMWFSLSGRVAVCIEGVATTFEAGQGMLMQSLQPYSYEVTSDGPHILMWCESEPLAERVLPDCFQDYFSITPAMRTLLDLGQATERRPSAIREPMCWHLGNALLVEVMAQLQGGAADRDAHTPAERLCSFVASEPSHPWTPERMARALGLSTRTLSRRLALDGLPPATELLWRTRALYGTELLARSRSSCADIAELAGFQSAAHFSRRVRELTGMTPTEIRNWTAKASLSERADFFRTIAPLGRSRARS